MEESLSRPSEQELVAIKVSTSVGFSGHRFMLKALRFSGNYGRNQGHFRNPPDWRCQNASNTSEYL